MLQLSPVCIYEGLPLSRKWEQPVVTQPLKGEKKSQTCVIKEKEAISVRGMRRCCISGANTETMRRMRTYVFQLLEHRTTFGYKTQVTPE